MMFAIISLGKDINFIAPRLIVHRSNPVYFPFNCKLCRDAEVFLNQNFFLNCTKLHEPTLLLSF